ncbi:MAG TPA: hypothetical protein PK402_04280 [Tepidisphaeraceae bacterium]|nr:hypothetical protein [Tepidisphaeraceae bacterium]
MIYGQQIIKGEFDPGQSLFGIPFLIGTCVLVPVCLMMTVGRVVISVHNGEGTIFSGIGPFGLRHKFDWTAVTGVSLALWGKSQPPMYRIQLLGTPRQFGTMVSRARQSYLIGTLRRLLKERRIQPKR